MMRTAFPHWKRALGAGCAAALAATAAIGVLRAQSPRQVSLTAPRVSAHKLQIDRGAAALWQTLLKLHTRASMLMIVAHPDDEDGGMLDYESRGTGARVALMTLNRGEGGANVMSPDYWDALGLVRTEELLHADRYYGVQEYFSRAVDYGFSKSRQEALQKWTHERVLYDAVRVVRMVRPLVVTSVFIGGKTDGHGNHQVAGEMAQEVFAAAGNPNVFPDQIKAGLLPWSPLKTYGRVPIFLEAGHISPKGIYDYATHQWSPAGSYNYITKKWTPGALSVNVEVPEGNYDPTLGLNFFQVAREGLSFQKSQNGGIGLPQAGQQMSSYHRFGSRVDHSAHETSFFQGIDTSLMGIADLAGPGDDAFLKTGLSRINALVVEAMRQYSATDLPRIAPVLAQGLKATDALIGQVEHSSLGATGKYNVLHELRVKQAQFNTALTESLELSMQATVAPQHPPTGMFAAFRGTPATYQVAIPGQKIWANVHLVNQSSVPVHLLSVNLVPSSGKAWNVNRLTPLPPSLAGNRPFDIRFSAAVPHNATFTEPYFSRPNIEQAYYNVNDKRYANLPLPPYPLSAWTTVEYDGIHIRLGEVVQSVARITGPGLVLNPLLVAPAISVSISPRAGITPLDSSSFQLTASLHSNVKGPAQGTLHLDLPAGWTSSPASAGFSMARDGADQDVTFTVTPANIQPHPYTVTAIAEYNGQDYSQGYHTVGYPGLRPYNLYRKAAYSTTGVDVKVAPHLTVGYIMGSGDQVPQSLENLGIHVHLLSSADLATGDLGKYQVILLGVRTYAVRSDLITYNSRLLNYVKNGGVVVVEYNTPEFDHNYGPYPYVMTNDPEEVTNEHSKMVILRPDNPVFTWPNHITVKDFDSWVEERGSKFMKSWDPHYQALLETHDPGQAPQKGGLLYTRYGKGVYVYCAYAFYRELPEGVPGAYRIFANLVSLPDNPHIFGAH